MTETMTKRVALKMLEALKEHNGWGYIGAGDNLSDVTVDDRVDLLAVARAAIEAMRKPTDEMINSCGNGECAKWAPGAWENYIDAALQETPDAR